MADFIELKEMDDDYLSSSGGGLELLMNDNVKEKSYKSSNINLEDLNKLETDLNNLSDDNTSNNYSFKSDLFGSKPSVSFENDINSNIKFNDTEPPVDSTWDGYSKYNNIPLNPDAPIPIKPKMSDEALYSAKIKAIRKLEQLEKKKGIKPTKVFTVDSPLHEIESEYEAFLEEQKRENAVKFQGNILKMCINGLEMLNDKFDPFDINLTGWSEQIDENISDYDDIFAALHKKYSGVGDMAPELRLLLQLGGSAMMVHMTNTMFKSTQPTVDDVFKQHPDMMRSFQNAAVREVSKTSPGLGGFLSNITGNTRNINNMGPPPPIATQGPNSVPPPSYRPGNNDFARQSQTIGKSNYEEGMSLRQDTKKRPEMTGPSDLNSILSGIKTKQINIQSQAQTNNNSTISVEELNELTNVNMPSKTKRKTNSKKNTVSIDI